LDQVSSLEGGWRRSSSSGNMDSNTRAGWQKIAWSVAGQSAAARYSPA
jgi:hypothetical protein